MSCNSIHAPIREAIIKWYERFGRRYPWRETRDPYSVLIAEMFLRRTTAEAVMRVYPTFIMRYGTLERLSRARLSALEKILTPLGLQTIRSRNVRDAAGMIIRSHGGTIPAERSALEKLPGVGRYTAAAVLNFAFGKPVPMVDGNIVHLLNRLFATDFHGACDNRAWSFMESFGAPSHDRRLYWGLIDLVATVCLRRRPRCSRCPVNDRCAHALGSAQNAYSD